MSTNLNSTSPYRPQLDALFKMGLVAFAVGVVVAGATLFGSLNAPLNTSNLNLGQPDYTASAWARATQAYLFAWLFWVGVTWGPVGVLLLHNTVGGGWGFVLKRQLTAATANLPLMAILFLPIALGIKYIYPWAQPEVISTNQIVAFQQKWWMAPPLVFIRMAVYFGILMLLARRVNNLTWNMTAENAERNVDKLNKTGPPGLILYVIIVTFWAIDVVMTITPAWASSIIGLLFVVGQGLSTWALMAALTSYIAGGKPPLVNVPRRYIRDIGNFTLAFTLLWSYMSFSQFLITFSGNQAEEAVYYQWRQKGGWQVVGLLLLAAHFILPFLALLSSDVKTHISSLGKLGLIIIFMRFVDLYYWTAPTWNATLRISPLDIALPLAIGGLWIAGWALNMRDKPIVPEHDSRLYGAWPLDSPSHHELSPEGYEEVPEDLLSEAEVAKLHG